MIVDGVFSGGGLKAFALVGAYQILEQKGFRFKRVAGTSAGAIVATFIAAGYTAKEIEEMLDEVDFVSLLDPRKTVLPVQFMKWLNLYWRMGIYKGKALENWFLEKLAVKNVYTFGDLPTGSLKIIASDLTNGKMIVLPDDLPSYGVVADSFPIARALRMSCGIPFFFEPVKLKVGSGDTIVVDGGVLSNFPMWVFDDEDGTKERPVIGVKLSVNAKDRPGYNINNGLQLFEALFMTMKDAHDEKYISRQLEKDIIFIPAENYRATQFDISEEIKEELMEKGRSRTIEFLQTWNSFRSPKIYS